MFEKYLEDIMGKEFSKEVRDATMRYVTSKFEGAIWRETQEALRTYDALLTNGPEIENLISEIDKGERVVAKTIGNMELYLSDKFKVTKLCGKYHSISYGENTRSLNIEIILEGVVSRARD